MKTQRFWMMNIPPLQWCHNERNGVSNHQPHDCLLNHFCLLLACVCNLREVEVWEFSKIKYIYTHIYIYFFSEIIMRTWLSWCFILMLSTIHAFPLPEVARDTPRSGGHIISLHPLTFLSKYSPVHDIYTPQYPTNKLRIENVIITLKRFDVIITFSLRNLFARYIVIYFVVVISVMNSLDIFNIILQGWFTGIWVIVWLPQLQ